MHKDAASEADSQRGAATLVFCSLLWQRHSPSNENKMSDGGRDRASLGVEVK
jgi:hypothetical protein